MEHVTGGMRGTMPLSVSSHPIYLLLGIRSFIYFETFYGLMGVSTMLSLRRRLRKSWAQSCIAHHSNGSHACAQQMHLLALLAKKEVCENILAGKDSELNFHEVQTDWKSILSLSLTHAHPHQHSVKNSATGHRFVEIHSSGWRSWFVNACLS